ncbi:uncharacterized protein C8A04DRAFT_32507 [Dichotomopilus funicola]|uniref:Zn(2)-C6 fungal-type domain-containing protein n=1 Tax=Dichotomopilus funicola TaxID=1934379 RepID=A0AAN6UVW4_9PEZI|nr:hypothetical protein C8A04DRAFT_32507 [Dichotomopilus funicola]
MADQLTDPDSGPQRKRIAVACGRCRKRKIRCSGDPGQGQPCSNCKNAGVDQCQFLRVASREAPMRHEDGDFGYTVGDARGYASRTPVGGGISYQQDLPSLGSADVLGSYRGSPGYAYTPASRGYYPAMPAYATGYTDEFEFGMVVPAQSVINSEPSGMMPSAWAPGPRGKPGSFNSMYMDSDDTYNSQGGTSLLHRHSQSVSSESPNFPFSGVAVSLPNPTGRSTTLPYPGSAKHPGASSNPTINNLADAATAATYGGGFEASGLPFSSASSGSLSSHPPPSSRSNSDSYTTSEGIFSEQEHTLQGHRQAFDMEHGHSAYMGGTPSSPGGHRHRQSLSTAASAPGIVSQTDGRHFVVANRH